MKVKRRDRERARAFGPERFLRFEDFFFFGHIDPVVRFWHALGMVVGLFFYSMVFVAWDAWSLLHLVLGAFFFYFVPLLSHVVYDGSAHATPPEWFLPSYRWVIIINLATLSGSYDAMLREFVRRYPFVRDAYELEA